VSLNSKRQTRVQQRPLYEPPKKHPLVLPNLPDRPPGSLPRYRPYTMDAYPGYREPSSARSPQERTSWNGRDESYRTSDRTDNPRTDTFYRGRSPGMSIQSALFLSYLCMAMVCITLKCRVGKGVTHIIATESHCCAYFFILSLKLIDHCTYICLPQVLIAAVVRATDLGLP
jgi:hypothetical protein